MRLDKFLADADLGTRSQVKEYIRKGRIGVNEKIVKDAGLNVDPASDKILLDGREISADSSFHYVILNKPQGYVCANSDTKDPVVFELLSFSYKERLFCVGRLDKYTEGLLLLTDNGPLSHALLSPKKHVAKTYEVTAAAPFTDSMLHALEEGVDIGEKDHMGRPELTKPAIVCRIEECKIHLTITEGKFHQVVRMCEAVGNPLTFLKRISFGPLHLSDALAVGESRELTKEEIEELTGGRL